MDKIRTFFIKKRGEKTTVFLVFVLGVILVIGSNNIDKNEIIEEKPKLLEIESKTKSYEEQMEKRLEKVLKEVEGAGEVKVLVTLATSKELVIEKNLNETKNFIVEQDGEGGVRESNDLKKDSEVVLITNDKKNEPLVLKEISPKIEGVLIIADGGDDIYIKDAFIKSVEALLGVEPHKIHVLKKKTN